MGAEQIWGLFQVQGILANVTGNLWNSHGPIHKCMLRELLKQIIDLKTTKAPLESFWIITQLYLETGRLPAMESRLAHVFF